MNVLIIGAGGREHTMAWKIKQSPKCENLYVAPGNGGTKEIATNLDIGVNEFEKIAEQVKELEIDLMVLGPEDPLVNGIVDFFRSKNEFDNLKIVGPKAEAAQLEGSKEFAKEFMDKYGIPTGRAKTITKENLHEAESILQRFDPPYVLKADGLAAGKGVVITEDSLEALKILGDFIEGKKFGKSSEKVLIEEFLSGIEVSFFVLTDGKDYRILPEAKDYKRIGEKDTGPNTGGMGAVSPVIFADRNFKEKVNAQIIRPTIDGLRSERIPYNGFIFFGLINVKGEPYVIEYNVRMGDPETQVVLPRIKNDFLDMLVATADNQLVDIDMEYQRFSAATVVYVSDGYPESYEKGHEISLGDLSSVLTFHAGTKESDGKLVTNGGRVLAITGLGKNLAESISKSYAAANEVNWRGKTSRSDIGYDLTNLGQ